MDVHGSSAPFVGAHHEAQSELRGGVIVLGPVRCEPAQIGLDQLFTGCGDDRQSWLILRGKA
jgi:hypothetical protein